MLVTLLSCLHARSCSRFGGIYTGVVCLSEAAFGLCNWIRLPFSMGCFGGKSRQYACCIFMSLHEVSVCVCDMLYMSSMYTGRKCTVLTGSDRFLIMLLRFLSQQPALVHELPGLICCCLKCSIYLHAVFECVDV